MWNHKRVKKKETVHKLSARLNLSDTTKYASAQGGIINLYPLSKIHTVVLWKSRAYCVNIHHEMELVCICGERTTVQKKREEDKARETLTSWIDLTSLWSKNKWPCGVKWRIKTYLIYLSVISLTSERRTLIERFLVLPKILLSLVRGY